MAQAEAIIQTFHRYLDAYFTRRDWTEAQALLHPDIKGFGTALDERIFSLEDAVKVAERDISQAPASVHPEITQLLLDQPDEHLGVITCELNISTETLGQQLKINNLRGTCVLQLAQEHWLIRHLHFSLPTQGHGEDEAYPHQRTGRTQPGAGTARG